MCEIYLNDDRDNEETMKSGETGSSKAVYYILTMKNGKAITMAGDGLSIGGFSIKLNYSNENFRVVMILFCEMIFY
jgi:hypothetical protein